jgi:hypothetical protein
MENPLRLLSEDEYGNILRPRRRDRPQKKFFCGFQFGTPSAALGEGVG